jgi:hypothetical protein
MYDWQFVIEELSKLEQEFPGGINRLKEAIKAGKIHGFSACIRDDDCGCAFSHFANIDQESSKDLWRRINKILGSNGLAETEIAVLMINPGATDKTNPTLKKLLRVCNKIRPD